MSESTFPVIAPFRGIRFATGNEKVASIDAVVTPPYDVIDADKQKKFLDRHPYNMIRLDLNPEEGDAKYQSARRYLLQWLEEGVLKRDDKPAFYLHDQTFTVGDRTYTRKGFIALRRLEEFGEGGIKPHENTLEGPKEDRFKLFKACSAHLSQIFGLYEDPGQEVESFFEGVRAQTPLLDFTTEDKERHRLWICSDPIISREINALLSARPIFIADGHHRYETSLRYSHYLQEGREGLAGDETLFYTMMYLTNMADDGLIVLPIHRLLHSLPNFSKDAFLDKVRAYFDVEKMEAFAFGELEKRLHGYVMDYHAYLLQFADGDSYIVRKRRGQLEEGDALSHLDPALRGLDVTVLHTLIIETILGLTSESQARESNIIYCKDSDSAKQAMAEGRAQLAIFMNATKVEEMQHVAQRGFKMPQKSTFFYPKLLTGLVINPIVPSEHVRF